MIIRELPDPNSFKDLTQSVLTNEVICTRTKAKYHYPNHTTPYLLVANFNETGNYRLNGRDVFVNDRLFYFLNAGDKLEINFKNCAGLETLLILFSNEFMQGWINYKHTCMDSLLGNGGPTGNFNWNVPNIPFEYNTNIIHHLNRLKTDGQKEDKEALLFSLLESFWVLKESPNYNLDNINAKRKSTREEIYRRLLMAKIFMHDNFKGSPTIGEIASEACLDKFHFLKLFKSFHSITPHQYLVKLKLEHACGLLASGKYSVFEACHQVGFESQGTFTNLFRKYYKMPPSALPKVPKFPILNK